MNQLYDFTKLSDEQIQEKIDPYYYPSPVWVAGNAELQRRAAARQEKKLQNIEIQVAKPHKPHWTITPAFWVAVAAAIFAAIAAWPVIREWIPALRPASTNSSYPPQ